MNENPIGIFDSGIGGLTVLKEMIERLPGEDTVYLGDTARVPYGTKSSDTVVRYSIEIADYLIRRHDVKLIVIACNTASAYALEELSTELNIPVIGVIGPGSRMAVRESKSGKIGVIGTEGTIKSRAYEDAIKKIEPKVNVTSTACPLLVPIAEEGLGDGDIAHLAIRKYLTGITEAGVDTLLLGCTHYPILKGAIADTIGRDIVLVDSAEATSIEVHDILLDKGLMRGNGRVGEHRYLVTDSPERFHSVGRRFMDNEDIRAELIELA